MHFKATMRCHFSSPYWQRSKSLIISNIAKGKPAHPFVADYKQYKSMEGNLAITVKTKNALDPTTLLLGIHPIDTLPCEQNNMHNDTSYSIVCKCKLAEN